MSKGIIPSIIMMKCPKCRKGHMFTKKNLYVLTKIQSMPEECEVCGQKMELEPGFYYGTGYVSYGICVGLSILNFILYYLLFGVSVTDNSLFYYLGINITLLLVLMPLIIRYSRVLYLYLFVRKEQKKNEEKERENDPA